MYSYSVTQWVMGNEPIEKSFQRLKKFGYDGIELAAEPYTMNADEILELMREYDLRCSSLCGIFSQERDLTAEDGTGAIQYLRDSVDFACKVGAPLIIVVPSPVGRTALPEGRSYEEVYRCAVQNLRIAADYAHSRGIRLAIEAINRYETYFLNTLDKAYRFVREVNHPAVRLMADLFHMSIEERSIPDSLRMVSDLLIHVHIADNTREAAGLGSTDFVAAMRQLKALSYEGYLTMEFMPRLADPYQSGSAETSGELMDQYAGQSIAYMKAVEKSVFAEY